MYMHTVEQSYFGNQSSVADAVRQLGERVPLGEQWGRGGGAPNQP